MGADGLKELKINQNEEVKTENEENKEE